MHSILVVDDEENIRQALKVIFDGEGYQSYFASSGKEAIKIIQGNQIDLMLLDLRLPDRNGLEVLKSVKATDPLVTVIIMTGYADVETAVQAMKEGAPGRSPRISARSLSPRQPSRSSLRPFDWFLRMLRLYPEQKPWRG